MSRRLIAVAVCASSLAAFALSGCAGGKYRSDFQVIVTNRTVNALRVTGNGEALGQVNANQSLTLTINLEESSPYILANGVAPSATARIVLTAQDLRTNVVSTAKNTLLTQGTPAYITFAAADFPVTTPTVARFSFSPAQPGPNQDVQFNASASTPANATFAWIFGGGSTGTGVNPTHRYTQVGSYSVTLTVTSDTGQVATATNTVQVSTNLIGQQVNFTFSPVAPGVNQEVFFNASTSTVSGGTYAWEFGNGSTATGITTTHRFARAGTYAVTLRATNPGNQSASTTRNVTVSATSPQVQATFVFSPTIPGVGQDVFFNSSGSMPNTGTFFWNFGDGSTGTGATPTKRYGTTGTYTISLTVTNDIGQSATTTRTITVAASSTNVVANFTFSPVTPRIGQDVFFNASASRPTTATYTWTFGDGSTGTGITPTKNYASAGTFMVTLVVNNGLGQQEASSSTITVTAATSFTADFTFSPTDPKISLGTNSVIFDATPSTAGATTWTWDFGDGTAARSGQRLSHTFARQGTWVVRLTISNGVQTATITRNVTVGA